MIDFVSFVADFFVKLVKLNSNKMKPPRSGHQAKAAAAAGSPCCVAILKRFTKWELALLVIGFISFISGTLIAAFLPGHAENLLNTQFRMSAPGGDGNSHLRNMWLVTPLDLYLDFYIFNWTNPHELFDSDKRPHVTQVGPYRFKERFEKADVIWNRRNSTVTYKNKKTYWFDPEGSNGTLQDQITHLNAVAVVSTSFSF